MGAYEDRIHRLYDERINTLGRIKTRSLGADTLSLTALRVLVYAQLEGGIKEQVATILRNLNVQPLQLGEIAPGLLRWRNPDALNRFRAAVNFDNVTSAFPFGNMPAKRVRVRPVNRVKEFNQMNSESIETICLGLGLDRTNITPTNSVIDELVGARNDAAHHGLMPSIANTLLEGQVRDEANMVGAVLTDIALQALTYFSSKLHRR